MKYTQNLNLFEYETTVDGDEFFSIRSALNENWDKIDNKVGALPANSSVMDQINAINGRILSDNELIKTSKNNLGFVKIGDNINVDEDGVISIDADDLGINEQAVKDIIDSVVPSMIADKAKTFTLGQVLTFLDPISVNNPDFNKMTQLDGKVISDYAGLYQNFIDSYVVPLYESNPYRFVSEEEWQEIKNQYGCCGYYVYDPETGYCRIPLLTGMITGTTELDGGEINAGGIPKDFGDLMKTKIYTVEEDSLPNFVTKIKNAIQVTGEIEEDTEQEDTVNGGTQTVHITKPVNITTTVDSDKIIDSFSSINIWKFKDSNGKQQSDYENEVESAKLTYENALQNISSNNQTIQNKITQLQNDKINKNNQITELESEIGEVKSIEYVIGNGDSKDFNVKLGYKFSSGSIQSHRNSGIVVIKYYNSNDQIVYTEEIENDDTLITLSIPSNTFKINVTCNGTNASIVLEELPITDEEHPSLIEKIENINAEISTKQSEIESLASEMEPLNVEKEVLERRLEELDDALNFNEDENSNNSDEDENSNNGDNNDDEDEEDPYPYYTREEIENRLSVIDGLLEGIQSQINEETQLLNELNTSLLGFQTDLENARSDLSRAESENALIDSAVESLLESNFEDIINGEQLKIALEDYKQAQRDLKEYIKRFTFKYYGNTTFPDAQATKVYFYLVVANKFESDTQLNLNNITNKMDQILDALVNNIINKDSSDDTESESGFLVTKSGITFQWGKIHATDSSPSEDGIYNINFQCQFINNKYAFFINPQVINEHYIYNEINKTSAFITIQTNLTQVYWFAVGIADPSETDEIEVSEEP